MDIAELSRRLENMIRIGTIAEVDHAARRVRVQSGLLLTDWLKWRAGRAGATRTWNPPTVGEQVMVLSPSGELANGIVIPSIYSDEHDAPSGDADMHVIVFPDGATITYNHQTGALAATGIKTALVSAETSITLDTPLTHITGQCAIDDLLTYGNGITGTGGDYGNHIVGNFDHVGGNLISNGIVVHSHHHNGVLSGDGQSGGPV